MTMEKNRCFAIMADEYIDEKPKSSYYFVRIVADSPKPVEEFIGFHELENI